MALKYFGTDGVRGMAGVQLTTELALRLGRAAGRALGARRVVLARDTRLSGPALEAACAAGLAEAGCDVLLAGVLPSPAVAYLVRKGHFDLGCVVSASHNPPQDNGIKFYDPRGIKLSPEEEALVEAQLDAPRPPTNWGALHAFPDGLRTYVRFMRRAVPRLSLADLKLVVDCAYGATCVTAPQVLAKRGAQLIWLGAEPDGARINSTGAAALDALQARVREEGADLGVAFDGDGDRCLLVDHRGEVVEGDRLLAALAPYLRAWGELEAPGVVFTVLANMGAEEYLQARGFQVVRVPVGDRNVSWALLERGWELGGEPSGHIVFPRYAPTGDGLLTALLVLQALHRIGKDLHALVAPVPVYPQVRADVPVVNREAAVVDPGVVAAVEEAQRMLNGRGRLVVRPSGTQSLVRVWAEGPEESVLREAVDAVVQALKRFRSG